MTSDLTRGLHSHRARCARARDAHLRVIKDGVDIHQITAVFD
jgi:hypothetical protein